MFLPHVVLSILLQKTRCFDVSLLSVPPVWISILLIPKMWCSLSYYFAKTINSIMWKLHFYFPLFRNSSYPCDRAKARQICFTQYVHILVVLINWHHIYCILLKFYSKSSRLLHCSSQKKEVGKYGNKHISK